MTNKKEQDNNKDDKKVVNTAPEVKKGAKSVYAEKKKAFGGKKRQSNFRDKKQDEFEQKIVDIARVTRVMAGGKRMRFRACVAIGDKKGRVAVGLAKGADVTIAINKAVSNAKKDIVEASIVNDTIPHQVYHKKGAAKIMLKPASKGRGVIAGGAIRMILELSGIHNITSKNLGTNNKVSVAKCTIEALSGMKRVEKQKDTKKTDQKTEVKKDTTTKSAKPAAKTTKDTKVKKAAPKKTTVKAKKEVKK